MNEVGHLERMETEGRPTVFMGEVLLPQISGEVCLVPHHSKRSAQSPDFAVKVRSRKGTPWVQMGNAWVKSTKEAKPVDFFSITIDGPTLAAPIYVSAFPDDQQPGKSTDKPSQFSIRWQRQRGQRQAAMPADVPPLDDEIPY